MTVPSVRTRVGTWPGLDPDFTERAGAAAAELGSSEFINGLLNDLVAVRGKGCQLGPPLQVRAEYGALLRRFASAYHRVVQTVVRAYRTDPEVRALLAVPIELGGERIAESEHAGDTIHLCRLDMMLEAGGGFKVLETNANCPGALLSMGIACRAWRDYLAPFFITPPEPLDHEWANWMANWFIQTAIAETGDEPRFVPLLRQEGGNRLEMPGLAAQLAEENVAAEEIDPRRVWYRGGTLVVDDRPTRHAYLKLGIPEFREHAGNLKPLLDTILSGRVFIPNGALGRFVGDNKLCLAVISDPTFRYLFDPADHSFVNAHVPWSRAITRCDRDRLRDIRQTRYDYVLKRPLDTKGRGVVVGREVSTRDEWETAVSLALREGWLVQQFCTTTRIEADFSGTLIDRHDLSLGVTNGRLAGVIARSSSELRLNVARSGRLHPVFVDSATY